MLRVLSDGNLSGFTQQTQFDSEEQFRALHLKRRQAIMCNMLGEGGDIQGTESQANDMKRRGRD